MQSNNNSNSTPPTEFPEIKGSPAVCWHKIKDVFNHAIWRHCMYYQARCHNQFRNQIELMLDLMPYWSQILNRQLSYGHYTFVNRTQNDVVVYLTLPAEQLLQNDSLLQQSICDTFYNQGIRVKNIYIKYLTPNQQQEKYYDRQLHNPLNNQRYQLFFLALESAINWQIYVNLVEAWEVTHYIKRYFYTNFYNMLQALGPEEIVLAEEAEAEQYTSALDTAIKPWTYIIQPCCDIGWILTEVHYLCRVACKGLRQHANYKAIARLVNQVYAAPKISSEATGLWTKVWRVGPARTDSPKIESANYESF